MLLTNLIGGEKDMNASEAYEKYKHIDKVLSEQPHGTLETALYELWLAVKYEALGQTAVTEIKINGKTIYGMGQGEMELQY